MSCMGPSDAYVGVQSVLRFVENDLLRFLVEQDQHRRFRRSGVGLLRCSANPVERRINRVQTLLDVPVQNKGARSYTNRQHDLPSSVGTQRQKNMANGGNLALPHQWHNELSV